MRSRRIGVHEKGGRYIRSRTLVPHGLFQTEIKKFPKVAGVGGRQGVVLPAALEG
jgi:hypothetical protein